MGFHLVTEPRPAILWFITELFISKQSPEFIWLFGMEMTSIKKAGIISTLSQNLLWFCRFHKSHYGLFNRLQSRAACHVQKLAERNFSFSYLWAKTKAWYIKKYSPREKYNRFNVKVWSAVCRTDHESYTILFVFIYYLYNEHAYIDDKEVFRF